MTTNDKRWHSLAGGVLASSGGSPPLDIAPVNWASNYYFFTCDENWWGLVSPPSPPYSTPLSVSLKNGQQACRTNRRTPTMEHRLCSQFSFQSLKWLLERWWRYNGGTRPRVPLFKDSINLAFVIKKLRSVPHEKIAGQCLAFQQYKTTFALSKGHSTDVHINLYWKSVIFVV